MRIVELIWLFDGRILERLTSGYWWFLFTVSDICRLFEDQMFLFRRLANAHHSFAGHQISIFFTMQSFYLSIYDVS